MIKFDEGYSKGIYLPDMLNLTVDSMCKMILDSKIEFETIAFRGISGALVAPAVAAKLGKTLLAVRKPTENSHDWQAVRGHVGAESMIIIDDFISTGSTIDSILKEVRKKNYIPCKGIFLYYSLDKSTSNDLTYFSIEGKIPLFHMAIDVESKKLVRINNKLIDTQTP